MCIADSDRQISPGCHIQRAENGTSLRAVDNKSALARERIVAGLEAARRPGRRGGCPGAIDPEKLEALLSTLRTGASKATVCRNFGVKRMTLYRVLARCGHEGLAQQ